MAPPIKYTTEAERREARIASKKRYYQKHKELEQEKARLRWKARVERERAADTYAPRPPRSPRMASIDERLSATGGPPSSSLRQNNGHESPAASPPDSPGYASSSEFGASDFEDSESFRPHGSEQRAPMPPTMFSGTSQLRRAPASSSSTVPRPHYASPPGHHFRGAASHMPRPPSPSDRFLPPKNRPAVWQGLTAISTPGHHNIMPPPPPHAQLMSGSPASVSPPREASRDVTARRQELPSLR